MTLLAVPNVSQGRDQTVIEALDPNLMGELSDNEDVRAVADEATERLRAALEAVGTEG